MIEDNYFIAEDVCDCLREHGAEIVGPAGTVEQGVRLARDTEGLDCAVLDLNVDGGSVEEIARKLNDKSVAFIFVTGYQTGGISAEFTQTPRLIKPFDRRQLVELVRRQVECEPRAG